MFHIVKLLKYSFANFYTSTWSSFRTITSNVGCLCPGSSHQLFPDRRVLFPIWGVLMRDNTQSQRGLIVINQRLLMKHCNYFIYLIGAHIYGYQAFIFTQAAFHIDFLRFVRQLGHLPVHTASAACQYLYDYQMGGILCKNSRHPTARTQERTANLFFNLIT